MSGDDWVAEQFDEHPIWFIILAAGMLVWIVFIVIGIIGYFFYGGSYDGGDIVFIDEGSIGGGNPEDVGTVDGGGSAGGGVPGYVCSSDAYNCGDFANMEDAQIVFDSCGGVGNDVHRLDGDKDGEACESLGA